jgi:hypothetical protein
VKVSACRWRHFVEREPKGEDIEQCWDGCSCARGRICWETFYSRKLLRLKTDAFHLILSPYKSYAYLPTLECLRTLATMLYKIYRTFWMNLEYYKPIITMDVLTETLTLKLKLTLISSLFDAKFWKELHMFCINVSHMARLVLRYQNSKIHINIYCTPWKQMQTRILLWT